MPVSLRSAIIRDTGSNSVNTVIELGTSTTRSYLTILVMKLRPLVRIDGTHASKEHGGERLEEISCHHR